MKLLTTKQYKLDKGLKAGVWTAGINLSPAREAGRDYPTSCLFSGWCAGGCLNKSGMNQMSTHLPARVARTRLLHDDPDRFYNQLWRELDNFIALAKRKGYEPAIRPNLLSDLPDLAWAIAARYPTTQVYDYTKWPKPWTHVRANYHLTYSWSEKLSQAAAETALDRGVNVAVIFNVTRGGQLPTECWGFPVLDGDENDLRYLDPTPSIVGLRWKGSHARMAKAIKAGFVVEA